MGPLDTCALVPGTDFRGGDILPDSDHLILPNAAACCAACQNHSGKSKIFVKASNRLTFIATVLSTHLHLQERSEPPKIVHYVLPSSFLFHLQLKPLMSVFQSYVPCYPTKFAGTTVCLVSGTTTENSQ